MKRLQKILEAIKERVLIANGEMWLTYSPGSGTTTLLRGATYWTDKSGDDRYMYQLADYITALKSETPIKKKKGYALYKIPVYTGREPANFEIWGGDQKPTSFKYLVLSFGKINVMSLFDSKNEALSWIKASTG